MTRATRITLALCAGITCAAILFGHGAGWQGAIWATWGLAMGYAAGSWMQAHHDARRTKGGDA